MNEIDSMYMDNLVEYIIDENKIVTYKWLCLTLNVKSNEAKKMLFHFVEKHKKEELNVTYLVSGSVYDESLNKDVQMVFIVKDTNLESYKKKLSKLFSLHIYSVQKSKLNDLHLVNAANYDITKDNIHESCKYSGIKCPSVERRSKIAPTVVKPHSVTVKPAPTLPKPSSISMFVAKANKPSIKEEIKTENKLNVKNTIEVKRNSKPVKPNSLASMFAKQTVKAEKEKSKPPVVEIKSEAITEPSQSDSKTKKSSLTSFLNKESSRSQIEETKENEVKSEEVESWISDSKVSPLKSSSKINSKKADVKTSSSAIKKKTSSSKRKPSKEKSLVSSKRRRIMTMDSASESSDEENDIVEMDEDPFLPPPAALLVSDDDDDDLIPGTPQESKGTAVGSSQKIRKGRSINKTYKDEDDFMVTKKEYVYTSDVSDDDENPIPKKSKVNSSLSPKKKNSPRKSSPRKSSPRKSSPRKSSPRKSSPKKSAAKKTSRNVNTASKQSSIMSFFQKK